MKILVKLRESLTNLKLVKTRDKSFMKFLTYKRNVVSYCV